MTFFAICSRKRRFVGYGLETLTKENVVEKRRKLKVKT